MTSFDIIDRGNYHILLIESFPCNSRDELHSREGQIIIKYKHDCECVNMCIAGRSKKEYRLDNKEAIQEKNKQYRLDHKEKAKEYIKEYTKNIV